MKYKGSAQRPLLTLDKKSAVVYRKQEEVSIPEKYQIIAAEAFKGNPKMKSLEIGPGMKKIGMRAFQGCIKLTKVRESSVGRMLFRLPAPVGNADFLQSVGDPALRI